MQRAKLDLNNCAPLWERKFDNRVSETEFDRLLRRDTDLPETLVVQDRIGNTCALAQDIYQCAGRPPKPQSEMPEVVPPAYWPVPAFLWDGS